MKILEMSWFRSLIASRDNRINDLTIDPQQTASTSEVTKKYYILISIAFVSIVLVVLLTAYRFFRRARNNFEVDDIFTTIQILYLLTHRLPQLFESS